MHTQLITRKNLVLLCSVVLLLSATGGLAGLVAAEDTPATPASYYGEVLVDGDPASEGTEIAAVVDGDVQDTIVVETEGEYGGPDLFDEKLTVDDAEDGDTVEFEIDGVTAEETVEWEEGDVQQVDLTFTGVDDGDAADDSADDGTDDTDPGSADDAGGDDTGTDDTGADDAADDTGADDAADDTGADDAADDTGADDVADDADDADAVTEEATASAPVETDADGSSASFDEDVSVESISFSSDDVEGEVSVTTTDGTPEDVSSSPGAAVQVSQVSVPEEASDDPATIRTSVSQDELDDIDASADDLSMFRLVDEEWEALDTTLAEETDDGVVLEADTPGFSYFSVSATGTPDAAAAVDPETAEQGEEITLDGSDSTDEYGGIEQYEWSINGETLSGETTSTVVDSPGEHTVELTVTNDAGATDTDVVEITVSEADPGGVDDPGSSDEGPDEEAAGLSLFAIGGLIAVAILAAVGAAVWRRRNTQKHQLR